MVSGYASRRRVLMCRFGRAFAADAASEKLSPNLDFAARRLGGDLDARLDLAFELGDMGDETDHPAFGMQLHQRVDRATERAFVQRTEPLVDKDRFHADGAVF